MCKNPFENTTQFIRINIHGYSKYNRTNWGSIYSKSYIISAKLLSELDFCTSAPCLNNGTCKNRVDGFECVCPNPWFGDVCENRKINRTEVSTLLTDSKVALKALLKCSRKVEVLFNNKADSQKG